MAIVRADTTSFKNLALQFKAAVPVIKAQRVIMMTEVTAATAREVTARVPVDKGFARASVQWTVLPQVGRFTTGQVFSSAPYMTVIEDGRAAGSKGPPIDVIQSWVRRRSRSAGKRERFGPARRRLSMKGVKGKSREQKIKSLSFAIQQSIAKRGIKAKRPFARSFVAAQSLINAATKKVLADMKRTLERG